MRRKVVKNTERILKNANNKQLCGPKTLTLRDEDFELKGENEDSVYRYDAVQRTASDDRHYFIFVDEFSAIIVPFEAFSSMDDQRAFMNVSQRTSLTQHSNAEPFFPFPAKQCSCFCSL